MSNWGRLVAVVGVVLGGASAMAAHPFHITMAEAEYNAESRKLEVALRVYHPSDLELAISRRVGRKVQLDMAEDAEALVRDYLRANFEVELPDQSKPKLEWVGMELTLKTAWLYFEVPMPDGPEGVTFRNRLLFDVERDQANTIVFRRGDERASLRLTRDEDRKTFQWPRPDDEPAPRAGSFSLP